MTFDAGSDAKGIGKVKTNRGTVIIPEKGDSCILHFLDGQQLSHPFILGSIFHGGNAENQGGGKGNHIKRFTDKAGSYWSFNTKEGSYEVYSFKGNSQILVDGKGNVSITTPNTITFTAKDIKLNASNSISLTSKPGEESGGEGIITAYADKSVSVIAEKENIGMEAKEKDITIKANTDVKVEASEEVKVDGSDIKMRASLTIRVSSSDTDII